MYAHLTGRSSGLPRAGIELLLARPLLIFSDVSFWPFPVIRTGAAPSSETIAR